jgi:hypothetical protein
MNPKPGDLPSGSKRFAFRGEGGSASARAVSIRVSGFNFAISSFHSADGNSTRVEICLCHGLELVSSSHSLY